MNEIVGFISAIFLAISSLPQFIETLRSKTVKGLSYVMIWSWFLGCFGMFWYVLFTLPKIPLLINYGFNSMICFGIIILYHRYK